MLKTATNSKAILSWLDWYSNLEASDRDLVQAVAAKGKRFTERALQMTAEHMNTAAKLAGIAQGVRQQDEFFNKPTEVITRQLAAKLGVQPIPAKKRSKTSTPAGRYSVDRRQLRWTQEERMRFYKLLLQIPTEQRGDISKMFGSMTSTLPGRTSGSISGEFYANFIYLAGWKPVSRGRKINKEARKAFKALTATEKQGTAEAAL